MFLTLVRTNRCPPVWPGKYNYNLILKEKDYVEQIDFLDCRCVDAGSG
jgi:hypothetical protein